MDAQRQRYLQVMGIQTWAYAGLRSLEQTPDDPHGQSATDNGPQWEALAAEVAGCERCKLSATRTQTVFGTGDRQARIMIVGEAPGADEDRQGEPFVGRAGQLLTRIIQALGYRREQVYIANIVKCRPPDNRNPEGDEVDACASFLRRQIELVQPEVIVAVGGVAAQNLLRTEASVGQLRGRRLTHPETGIPVVVTYHPAYLLRSPGEKRKVWLDLRHLARTGQPA